jgi:TolB-like protein
VATEHQTGTPTGDPARVDKRGRASINFFAELKRRNVYKVAVAYIVAGWALSQGIAQVFPVFDVPNWVIRSIVVLIIIGLPIALVLAWMFELTPQGIKRAETANALSGSMQKKKHAWIYVVAIGAAISVTLFVLGRYSAFRQTLVEARQPRGPSLSEKSIAVLPFENLSRDPDNAYFATGIQDEILTRIAKIGALKVISRSSMRQYSARPENLSDVAHQLAVANILEGSVQRVANQVHINVQLIRAATDEHVWAESYDRNVENIFGIETEVATEVAEALKAKLNGSEEQALKLRPTANAQAYDAYLRGVALYAEAFTMDANFKSMRPFEEAVRLDPNFALAWAMLARLNSQCFAVGIAPTASWRAAAQKSLETAFVYSLIFQRSS